MFPLNVFIIGGTRLRQLVLTVVYGIPRESLGRTWDIAIFTSSPWMLESISNCRLWARSTWIIILAAEKPCFWLLPCCIGSSVHIPASKTSKMEYLMKPLIDCSQLAKWKNHWIVWSHVLENAALAHSFVRNTQFVAHSVGSHYNENYRTREKFCWSRNFVLKFARNSGRLD